MSVIYFDTSAVNWLADDPNCSDLLKALTKEICAISVFTVAELASTPNEARRIRLLSLAKKLVGDFRPLAMPGEILTRSLLAYANNQATMDASMGSEWDGLWFAFSDPPIIDKQALLEIQEWKSNEEKFYQDMHDNGRPYVQNDLSKLSKSEQDWMTKCPSRLLKHFSKNRAFVVNAIINLAPPKMTISSYLAEEVLDNLDQWRFYLAGMVCGLYYRSLQTNSYGRHSNPGSIDTQQSIYLAGCDIFVTADEGKQGGPWGGQLAMLRTIIPFGLRHRTVCHYNRLKEKFLNINSGA